MSFLANCIHDKKLSFSKYHWNIACFITTELGVSMIANFAHFIFETLKLRFRKYLHIILLFKVFAECNLKLSFFANLDL